LLFFSSGVRDVSWGPIIGVVVGFLLSQLANVIAWLISSRKEKQLVRLLGCIGDRPKLGSRLTWRIYEEIAQVQTLHAWLLAVAGESETGEGSFPSASRAIRSHGMESATFKTKKARAVFDLRRTIQQLLEAGNPLGTSKLPVTDHSAESGALVT